MRTFAVISLAAGAVSLAACVPPSARRHREPLKPVAQLDCPARQGDLRKASAAPDGRSCAYVATDGSQVELRLVPVSAGDSDAALARIENELTPLAPEDAPDASGAGVNASAMSKSPSTAAAAAQAEADAHADAEAAGPAGDWSAKSDDHVNINLPGVHIRAEGEKANVRVGGLHIDADDGNDHVRVMGGPPFGRPGQFTIDANDHGAVIRAQDRRGPNVRATLIMASDQPSPQGWRAVGYQARGPRAGPLVVAVIHAKGDDHDQVFQDSGRLAAHMAGG